MARVVTIFFDLVIVDSIVVFLREFAQPLGQTELINI